MLLGLGNCDWGRFEPLSGRGVEHMQVRERGLHGQLIAGGSAAGQAQRQRRARPQAAMDDGFGAERFLEVDGDGKAARRTGIGQLEMFRADADGHSASIRPGDCAG